MKNILLSLLTLVTLSTCFWQSYALVDYRDTTEYLETKTKIDTIFQKLETKLSSYPDDTQIKIYLRLQNNVSLYLNKYDETRYPEIHYALIHINSLAQNEISAIRGMVMTQTDSIIEEVIEEVKQEIGEQEGIQEFKIIPIQGKSISVKDGENIILWEFRITWEQKDVNMLIEIQSQNGEYRIDQFITLSKDNVRILGFGQEQTSNGVKLTRLNLSEGVYSISAEIRGSSNSNSGQILLYEGGTKAYLNTLTWEASLFWLVADSSNTRHIEESQLENTEDLTLWSFQVVGNRSNTDFYIWIPEGYQGQYNGPVSLFRNGVQVASSFPRENWGRSSVSANFQNIDFVDGEVYEVIGTYGGVKQWTSTASFLHYGDDTIYLDTFYVTPEKKYANMDIQPIWRHLDFKNPNDFEKVELGRFSLTDNTRIHELEVQMSYSSNTSDGNIKDILRTVIAIETPSGKSYASEYKILNENIANVKFFENYSETFPQWEYRIYAFIESGNGILQSQLGDYSFNFPTQNNLEGHILSTINLNNTSYIDYPEIIAGKIEDYERGPSELWTFEIQWPSFTLNELQLELNIHHGWDDFEIRKWKVYILDENLQQIASNSWYDQADNGNGIIVTFKSTDIQFSQWRYTIWVQDLSVDERTEIGISIRNMEVNENSPYEDYLEDLHIGELISEVEILATD